MLRLAWFVVQNKEQPPTHGRMVLDVLQVSAPSQLLTSPLATPWPALTKQPFLIASHPASATN